MGICRRIVGMVAPHDTDKFETPLYDVQAQWESLRAFPINTGQLLDRAMELRGRKACDTCEAATPLQRPEDTCHNESQGHASLGFSVWRHVRRTVLEE